MTTGPVLLGSGGCAVVANGIPTVGGLAITDDLMAAFAVLVVLLTQLGDVWFYFVVLSSLYWFGPAFPRIGHVVTRRRAAFLLALALGAMATTTALKYHFAAARPPGAEVADAIDVLPAVLHPIYHDMSTATGYSFPSGHALGSAVVYGGAALALGDELRRRRLLVAAGVVGIIAFTRVFLENHHLVDVVAGVGVGAVFLAVAWLIGDRGDAPGRVFSLAVAVALVGAAVRFTPDTMAILGAAIGARLTWGIVGGAVTTDVTRREAWVATAVGLPLAGGLFVWWYAYTSSATLAFLVNGLLVAVILTAPLLGEFVSAQVPYGGTPAGDDGNA